MPGGGRWTVDGGRWMGFFSPAQVLHTCIINPFVPVTQKWAGTLSRSGVLLPLRALSAPAQTSALPLFSQKIVSHQIIHELGNFAGDSRVTKRRGCNAHCQSPSLAPLSQGGVHVLGRQHPPPNRTSQLSCKTQYSPQE